MSRESSAPPSAGHGGGGYEKSDLSVRAITVFGIVLAAVLVAALVSMAWLFGFFDSWQAKRDTPPSPLALTRSGPQQPLLQVHAVQDLKSLRAAEDSALTTYGWASREDGTARIPIGRAIEILVERGLPVPSKAPAAPAKRGGAR